MRCARNLRGPQLRPARRGPSPLAWRLGGDCAACRFICVQRQPHRAGRGALDPRRAAGGDRGRCCWRSSSWPRSLPCCKRRSCCAWPRASSALAALAVADRRCRRRFLTPAGNTLRPHLARRRLLAADLRLRAAARRCADPAAAWRRWPRVGVLLSSRRCHRPAALVSGTLEQPVDPARSMPTAPTPSGARRRRTSALALGSLAAAVIVGLPLGILCHRVERLRAGVLNVLNIVQTIPSIALFGLLIAPLGWVAANVPGAAAIGIRGIGAAPALGRAVPLFAAAGRGQHRRRPRRRAARRHDAARGMGMTDRQACSASSCRWPSR